MTGFVVQGHMCALVTDLCVFVRSEAERRAVHSAGGAQGSGEHGSESGGYRGVCTGSRHHSGTEECSSEAHYTFILIVQAFSLCMHSQ